MQSLQKQTILSLLFLLLIAFANAQTTGAKVFSISDDASSTKILSLIKHSKGFLVAGTTDGIFHFNGSTFQPYNFDPSIKKKAVTAITEATGDTVWVGFKTGEIGFISNGLVQLLNPEEGYPKVAITCILRDHDGVTYFSTAGEGIYYYQNKRLYNINSDDGLSDNYVYDIKLTYGNSIIAATDHGVNICSINNGKKKVEFYAGNSGIPDNIVRSLSTYSQQAFVIGMQDKGIGLFDITAHTFSLFNNIKEWKYGQVNSIYNSGNEVWIGTESSGLLRANANSVTPVIFANDVKVNKVSHLLQDDEGNIWFSSNNELVRTNGVQLQNVIPFNNDLFEQVHTVLSDKENGIWINYASGLKHYRLVNNVWSSTNIVLPSVNERIDITSLYQDKYGNIWIGTMGNGIMVLDAKTGRTRKITEGLLLVDGNILSINGRGDDIWISSLSGPILCKLSPQNSNITNRYNFQNFSNVSGIGSNYVYSILPDSKGRVWFATDGRGITMYENGKFSNFNEKNGIKSKVIYTICEDQQGNLWFSTLNAGIYKYDGKTFTNISTDKGLNDPTVTSISTDKKGNIIAVTKKGVNIIDSKTLSISYIDADQGFSEWNTDPNCIAITSTGSNLFVTSQGVISFNPSYISLQPKVVLESVQLFLKDIDFARKKNFSHDENNLSFTFSGISLSHPNKVQYQYRLQGLSSEWVNTKDNKINFPKLPPGNYTFVVRAALNNNFTNNADVKWDFVISTPFWWRWWFITLVVVTLGVLLYYYIKDREKRVKTWGKLEKERIQSQFETLKSQVNPHFLFNSFNTLISVIEESPDKAVEYVEHLSDLYRKIVTYRDKDLIFLAEEIELIRDYFFIQQKRFGKNLVLNVDLLKDDLEHYLIAPLTLQLLAENAVKHNAISADTPLYITINIQGKYLVVRNNLNPKYTVEKGAGMGLQNIQNRYKLLNTDFVRIEKTGKEFVVYIPLIKSGT